MTHYRTSVRRRWYKKAPDDAGALNLLEAGSQSCLADACTDGKARETGARCAFRWFCGPARSPWFADVPTAFAP